MFSLELGRHSAALCGALREATEEACPGGPGWLFLSVLMSKVRDTDIGLVDHTVVQRLMEALQLMISSGRVPEDESVWRKVRELTRVSETKAVERPRALLEEAHGDQALRVDGPGKWQRSDHVRAAAV